MDQIDLQEHLLMSGKLERKTPEFQAFSRYVPHTIPNLNELLEDTRDLARIWDLYGHLIKETGQGL